MAQPRFRAPSLQELTTAFRVPGGQRIRAGMEGLEKGFKLGSTILGQQEDRASRRAQAAQKLKEFEAETKLAGRKATTEEAKTKETKRAARAEEKRLTAEAPSKKALRDAQAAQARAQAEFLSRKPGSTKLLPPTDVELSEQATKETDAFLKTLTAGTGIFGRPELEAQREELIAQRTTELIQLRDQEKAPTLPEPKATFTTMEEAQAAMASGQIQSGDRVLIGGKGFTAP